MFILNESLSKITNRDLKTPIKVIKKWQSIKEVLKFEDLYTIFYFS